jgi:hypothetical protein
LGGEESFLSSDRSSILGGKNNSLTGNDSIIGGSFNNVQSQYSTCFGAQNTVNGTYASVLGGEGNTSNGVRSSIVGGFFNNISSGIENSSILGGTGITITNVNDNNTSVAQILRNRGGRQIAVRDVSGSTGFLTINDDFVRMGTNNSIILPKIGTSSGQVPVGTSYRIIRDGAASAPIIATLPDTAVGFNGADTSQVVFATAFTTIEWNLYS